MINFIILLAIGSIIFYFLKKKKTTFNSRTDLYSSDLYYNQAIQYSNAGNYKKAIELYTKSIQMAPKDEQAYNNRGTCYQRLRNYEKAISDFSKAIEINPTKANAYSNRAGCFLEIGDFEKALSDDTKAVELDLESAINHNNKGFTNLKLERYDGAIQDFTNAINLKYDYYKAYQNRGIAFLKSGAYQQSIEDLTHVIKNDPNDEAYQNRADAYYLKKDFNYAINDWENAIRLNSNLKEVLRRKITEAKTLLGVDPKNEKPEKTYEMDKLYERLKYLLKNSQDGTVNLKHDTYDFMQFMKMADILNDTYTQQKTMITLAEIRDLILKVKTSNKVLTVEMLNEMVEILMNKN